MIISVRGSLKHKNRATELVSLLAATTALGKNRKTLVIQLTNTTTNNCEDALIGKRLSEEIKADEYSFSDEGIDALFRYVETRPLTQEAFGQFVTPLVSYENYLDIAKVTSKPEFVYELGMNKELIEKLLKDASQVYHCIYVLLPHNDDENGVIEYVTKLCDYNIVAVSQGVKEGFYKADNTILVVNDFENESMFTVREMKKKYEVKKLFGIMHSVAYKDAYKSKNLLRFVAINIKNEKEDNNFIFMSEVYRILSNYMMDEEMMEQQEETQEQEQQVIKVSKKPKKEKVPLKRIERDMVSVTTTKKRLFRKEKNIITVEI